MLPYDLIYTILASTISTRIHECFRIDDPTISDQDLVAFFCSLASVSRTFRDATTALMIIAFGALDPADPHQSVFRHASVVTQHLSALRISIFSKHPNDIPVPALREEAPKSLLMQAYLFHYIAEAQLCRQAKDPMSSHMADIASASYISYDICLQISPIEICQPVFAAIVDEMCRDRIYRTFWNIEEEIFTIALFVTQLSNVPEGISDNSSRDVSEQLVGQLYRLETCEADAVEFLKGKGIICPVSTAHEVAKDIVSLHAIRAFLDLHFPQSITRDPVVQDMVVRIMDLYPMDGS